jgi:hypothetical protein
MKGEVAQRKLRESESDKDQQRSRRGSPLKQIHRAWYTTLRVPLLEWKDRPCAQSKGFFLAMQFRLGLMFSCNIGARQCGLGRLRRVGVICAFVVGTAVHRQRRPQGQGR